MTWGYKPGYTKKKKKKKKRLISEPRSNLYFLAFPFLKGQCGTLRAPSNLYMAW